METEEQKFVPRCLFLDSDSLCIEELNSGVHKELYNKNWMTHGKESAASNSSYGAYIIGRELMEN